MTAESDTPVTFGGYYTDDPLNDSKGEQVVCRFAEGSLSWQRSTDSTDGQSETKVVIAEDHIICMQQTSANASDDPEWNLYYVQVTPKPAEVAEQEYHVERNTYLKRLVLVSPPSTLVERYELKPDSPLVSTPSIKPVVSTLSGGQHAEAIFRNLLKPFLTLIALQTGRQPQEAFWTTSASSITELAEGPLLAAAQRGEKQLVILLSGDGGIVDIVNAIGDKAVTTPPAIALLPCGTGNALANSTSVVPLASPTLGLRTLALGSAHPLPLLEATFDPPATVYVPEAEESTDSAPAPTAQPPATVSRILAAVVVSWGLHAALVGDSDTPAYRKHGAARFGLAAHENLFPSDGSLPHAYKGELSLAPYADDDAAGPPSSGLEPVPRHEHAYVLATLVACLERGFRVSPAARPLDGCLRVVHFGPQPEGGEGVMRLMRGAYGGGAHVEDPAVGYAAARLLRLRLEERAARWRRVCVDGKMLVAAEDGLVQVEVAKGEPAVELVHVA